MGLASHPTLHTPLLSTVRQASHPTPYGPAHRQQASGIAPGPGDMDLDPETGSYKLSASVPGVCLNELRKTLGIRPPPYAVAGAVRGVLHCSGPLEQPVFAGED